MSSNNVTTTFSAEKSVFLPFSGQAKSKFYVHLMHFSVEDRVTSVNDFCTASTKTLVKQILTN